MIKVLTVFLMAVIVVLSAGVVSGDDNVQETACGTRIEGEKGIKLEKLILDEDGNVTLNWSIIKDANVGRLEAKEIRIYRRVKNTDTSMCSEWKGLENVYGTKVIFKTNTTFRDVTPIVKTEPTRYQYTIELKRARWGGELENGNWNNPKSSDSYVSGVGAITMKEEIDVQYVPKVPEEMYVYAHRRHNRESPNAPLIIYWTISMYWTMDQHAPAFVVKGPGLTLPVVLTSANNAVGDKTGFASNYYKFDVGEYEDTNLSAGDYTFYVSPCFTDTSCGDANKWQSATVTIPERR